MAALRLVSSVASLIALAGEIPYADVAPDKERKAPIWTVLGVRCSIGVEHADTSSSKDRIRTQAFVMAGITTVSANGVKTQVGSTPRPIFLAFSPRLW